jgi:hypothetical protein
MRAKIYKNRAEEEARSYIIEWGDNETFWKETDYRVKEFVKKIESDVGAAIGMGIDPKIPGLTATLSTKTAQNLTEEQKGEIVQRGQPVVDSVQLQKLNAVIETLDKELINDKKKKYYIVIDRLDERWIQNELRYKLIRALIEAIRDINSRLSNVKIIISLREAFSITFFQFSIISVRLLSILNLLIFLCI